MNKVYVVLRSTGSWDDSWLGIDKIFSKREDAEKYADEINQDMANKKSAMPLPPEDYDVPGWEERYEKYEEEYNKWTDETPNWYDVIDFNECKVQEFEIN